MMQYIIYSLTCFQGVNIGIFYQCFPTSYHENTLTYYYTNTYTQPRVAPNGSLRKWWGYASKWAHPP